MKKLVEELLFLARGEIGRNPFDPKPMSLTAMLREVCEESAMIDGAHEWRLLGDDAEEVRIVADAEMLKQCARALCENARKYTPEGGRIVLVGARGWRLGAVHRAGRRHRHRSRRPAPHLRSLLPLRSCPRARQRRLRAWLAIANWIVERHGGSFDVVSSEGVGTRFTVRLPVRGIESDD